MTLIEQAKSTAKRLVDLMDQISHREHEMSDSEYSTARLENVRSAKASAEEALEAIELL